MFKVGVACRSQELLLQVLGAGHLIYLHLAVVPAPAKPRCPIWAVVSAVVVDALGSRPHQLGISYLREHVLRLMMSSYHRSNIYNNLWGNLTDRLPK
jgi:hypothetical protein